MGDSLAKLEVRPSSAVALPRRVENSEFSLSRCGDRTCGPHVPALFGVPGLGVGILVLASLPEANSTPPAWHGCTVPKPEPLHNPVSHCLNLAWFLITFYTCNGSGNKFRKPDKSVDFL